MIFFNENRIWKKLVGFWRWKLTLKVQFWHFSREPYCIDLQNATFFLKPIHFFCIIELILDTPGLNKKPSWYWYIDYLIFSKKLSVFLYKSWTNLWTKAVGLVVKVIIFTLKAYVIFRVLQNLKPLNFNIFLNPILHCWYSGKHTPITNISPANYSSKKIAFVLVLDCKWTTTVSL